MILHELRGIHYLTGEAVNIKMENGLIASIEPVEMSDSLLYLTPGFIDNQVNGYAGMGFSIKDLTLEQVKQVILELRKQGVTTFLPTLITSSFDITKSNLTVLAKLASDSEWGQSIPSFHLEGPYISEIDGFRGAHDRRMVRNPDWDEFCELNNAANGRIKQITLAPEKPGAMEFIKKCCEHDIIVGIGHSNANSQIIHKAVQLGARISTHLGNACANQIHRHNNPLWPQLANENLYASLILDGFHLNKDEVKVFYRAKGQNHIILVSDMTEMAGLPAGEYYWENQKLTVKKDGRLLLKENNILAGASFPLYTGAENMIRFTNCTLQNAIEMITKNPAKLNHFNDRGEITVGKRADIVLFKYDDNKLIIKKTIIGGVTS